MLPGVTVEAGSPALIEKVAHGGHRRRRAQYKIVDLRPGTYTVTFTLPGFSTVKREGHRAAGDVHGDGQRRLRVGALEETITVSGESPVVDMQNTCSSA